MSRTAPAAEPYSAVLPPLSAAARSPAATPPRGVTLLLNFSAGAGAAEGAASSGAGLGVAVRSAAVGTGLGVASSATAAADGTRTAPAATAERTAVRRVERGDM